MKERFIGVGLGVGAVLTLGIVWTDSAHAFSLDSSVTAGNSLKTIDAQGKPVEIPFEKSSPRVVGSELELTQFGGIWDIDFSDKAVLFSINSRFGNVVSGEDVYRLTALNFGKPGQSSVKSLNVVYFGNGTFKFDKLPISQLIGGNTVEVVFPLGFAKDLTSIPKGELAFRIDLTIEQLPPDPDPVPTPALLPGLVGMGLAALRKRREENNRAD